jgi:hypothetical protein
MSWLFEILLNVCGDFLAFLMFEKLDRYEITGRTILWTMLLAGTALAVGVIIVWL